MSSIKGVPAMDVLPEYFPYRDDGCDESASCLACSLPTCKYDDPDRFHRERRAHRDQQVLDARLREGITITELSRRFRISQRTVHRILARSQDHRLESHVNGEEGRLRTQSGVGGRAELPWGGGSLPLQRQSRNSY